MNRKERGEHLQTQVEEAFQDLEHQLSLGYTEDFVQLLEFYANFRSYSFGNTLLILMQRPTATQCAGFRKWEKLGYKVRRGERAIWIRGPQIAKVTDEETGEITERLVGWLALPVFDVEQLEGNPEIPTFTHPLEGDWDWLYTKTQVMMGSEGILVIEEPLPSGVHGMSMGGKVVVSPALSISEKVLTLLHEWGHEVLHRGEDRESLTKTQKELEAEATSFVMARVMGLDNPFSRNYITHYLGTVEDLHASMSRIHMAVKHMYGLLRINKEEEREAA